MRVDVPVGDERGERGVGVDAGERVRRRLSGTASATSPLALTTAATIVRASDRSAEAT